MPILWFHIYLHWTILETEAKKKHGSSSSCKKIYVYDFRGGYVPGVPPPPQNRLLMGVTPVKNRGNKV